MGDVNGSVGKEGHPTGVAHCVRISTEEQKGYSIRDQRRMLDGHSGRETHDIVEWIFEEGEMVAHLDGTLEVRGSYVA
jgi:hypothetical protein